MATFSTADLSTALIFAVRWVWLGWAELIWAGPVWDDWVEPVWFLLPELCCLCRVFVPALQAPTVINSPGSLCMLTHTDKKWWRERLREGGWESNREGRVTGRHIQWHMLTQTDREQQLKLRNAIHVQDIDKHIHLGWWMAKYKTKAVVRETYSSAFLGVIFPGKSRGKKRDGVRTVNFNYTLFQAAFGQLIPWLPSFCGHRRRRAQFSQATVSQDSGNGIKWCTGKSCTACLSSYCIQLPQIGSTVETVHSQCPWNMVRCVYCLITRTCTFNWKWLIFEFYSFKSMNNWVFALYHD